MLTWDTHVAQPLDLPPLEIPPLVVWPEMPLGKEISCSSSVVETGSAVKRWAPMFSRGP